MSEKKTIRRSYAIALGIICIVLASGVVGALAYYVPLVNDKDNAISMLNSQISRLNSNLTNLQNQLNSIRNWSTALDVIISNPSDWVYTAVIVEGNISGPPSEGGVPENMPPWNYELSSGGHTIGVSWGGIYQGNSIVYDSAKVMVLGVVFHNDQWGYFIQAEKIDSL